MHRDRDRGRSRHRDVRPEAGHLASKPAGPAAVAVRDCAGNHLGAVRAGRAVLEEGAYR